MFRLKLIWVRLGFLDFHICALRATVIKDFFVFFKGSLFGFSDDLRIAFRQPHAYLPKGLFDILTSLLVIFFLPSRIIVVLRIQLLVVFLHL